MRRLALFFSVVLLVGLFAVGVSPALAANTDWAVNGTPLAPGQAVSVKFASITPIQLIASTPEQGIDITCASWKAKGTLVGGDGGTGELLKAKFAHCTQMEEGMAIKAKVQMTSVKLHTGPPPGAGSSPTTKFELIGSICTFKKPRCEPPVEVTGSVNSLGPVPGEAGNVVEFPQPALPGSALTIGGSSGELVGKAIFKLAKHAMLSQVES